MPDTASALDAIVRVPNLEGCEVKVLDLAFHSRGVGGSLPAEPVDLEALQLPNRDGRVLAAFPGK
jgi:hypothetical protein